MAQALFYLFFFLISNIHLSSQTSPLPHRVRDTNPSSPTTTTSPVALKTDVPDCVVRGTATKNLLSQLLATTTATDIVSCQYFCEVTSRCESWSFYPSTLSPVDSLSNCAFYTTYIRNTAKWIDVDRRSGTVFSDKYPEDGSNFGVGNPSWGVPEGGKKHTASAPMK